MWNRQQVKEQAKQIMKRNYWKMFVVTLIASTLTGEKTTIIERVQDFASNNISYDTSPIFYSSNFQYIFYSFISIASILGILYTIFIGNVIVNIVYTISIGFSICSLHNILQCGSFAVYFDG